VIKIYLVAGAFAPISSKQHLQEINFEVSDFYYPQRMQNLPNK